MARLISLCLVVLLTFFLVPPIRAEDKPSAKPGDMTPTKPVKPADARRAALIRAGYTHVPLALWTTLPASLSLGFTIDGAVGSEKAKLFLDSGHQDTLLDLKLAKRLNLSLGEEFASSGLGSVELVGRRTHVPGLMIGPYDTRKDWSVSARAVDLSGWPEWGGVLGMDVIDRYAAVVDYPARALYLRSPLTNAWPRLAGTWKVTSWQEDGAARKLDPNVPPTFTFADRRLKVADGGTSREYGIQLMPYGSEDVVLLFDPKQEGKPVPVVLAAGRVKVKDGAMTACLDLNKPKGLPTAFAASKGSGYVLLELNRTAADAQKPPADPLRDLLLKDGYTAVRLDREPEGWRTVAARIRGHDLQLLVDTGASYSAFDAMGLDKWGAERLGKSEVKDLVGKVKVEEVCLRGLTFGGYDTRRAWLVVNGGGFDLAGLNKTLADHKRRPIHGALGNLDLLTGSAVIDFDTNTLYLRPVKEILWPQLEGKWVAVRYESDGRKGQYNPGDAAIEFKDSRVRFTTPQSGTTERGFHLQNQGDRYRVGLFAPGADELADGFTYSGLGLFKLSGDTLTLVTAPAPEQRGVQGIGRRGTRPLVTAQLPEPTEFAAPKGSGLLLVEYERAK